MLEWYLVWGTLFVAAWFAAGVATICFDKNARASGGRRWAVYGCLLLLLAASWRPLQSYRGHSKQANRDSVDLAHASTEAGEPVIAYWWTPAVAYDPLMRVVFKPEQFDAIEKKARDEGRDFYFILGSREQASAEQPGIVQRLEGPDFEKIGEFFGLEEAQFRNSVYRRKP